VTSNGLLLFKKTQNVPVQFSAGWKKKYVVHKSTFNVLREPHKFPTTIFCRWQLREKAFRVFPISKHKIRSNFKALDNDSLFCYKNMAW